jgi:hypothetical protein
MAKTRYMVTTPDGGVVWDALTVAQADALVKMDLYPGKIVEIWASIAELCAPVAPEVPPAPDQTPDPPLPESLQEFDDGA